ncbi:MAG TPA: DUF6152 family protein [Vicinamibacterales bacterium]|jgi:hypothetical protein
MKKTFLYAVALAVASLVPGAAWAHHGDAGRYNEDPVTLKGTVVQLVMVNPHALIIFDVNDGGKATRWTAELGGPQQLVKQFGWSPATVKAGMPITLIGRVVKSGDPYMNLTERSQITMTDSGKEIYRTANFGQSAPAAQ